MTLLADENFDHDVLRGLKRRGFDLDILTANDVGLLGQDDISILRWAAAQNIVLITSDAKTMPNFANQLLRDGEPMAGVIVVPDQLAIRTAIEELATVILCSHENEGVGLVRYLPL